MIRPLLAGVGLLLAAGASVRLVGETRYLLGAGRPIAAVLLPGETHPAGVVVVFQPEDCLAGGALVHRWNEWQAAGTFPVRGAVVGDGGLSDRQRRMFHDLHSAITTHRISSIDAATVGEKLGYTATPFVVVLDSRGRVTASFPAEQNVSAATVQRLVQGKTEGRPARRPPAATPPGNVR